MLSSHCYLSCYSTTSPCCWGRRRHMNWWSSLPTWLWSSESSSLCYLSVSISTCSLLPHSWELCSRRWPQLKNLHLSRHSLFACSSLPSLPLPTSFMFWFTPSFHLPGGQPLLPQSCSDTFFHKFHSSSSHFSQILLKQTWL